MRAQSARLEESKRSDNNMTVKYSIEDGECNPTKSTLMTSSDWNLAMARILESNVKIMHEPDSIKCLHLVPLYCTAFQNCM